MSDGQPTREVLAGAVKRPITPTVKGRRVIVAGHEGGRLATEIHDELWARALAIRCGDTVLTLVALDLIGLFREQIASIRELASAQGIPVDHLIVTCTHNHAGPDTLGLWERGPLGIGQNLRYMDFLQAEVVRIVQLATEAMEPAEVHLARSEVTGLTSDEESKELSVLQFRTAEDRPLATVVNFGLVPQVIDETNTMIGADFATWLYRELEGSRDEVAMYICADANEYAFPVVHERSWDEAKRVGQTLAAAARQALEGVSPTEIDKLLVRTKPIAIPPGDSVFARLRQAGLRRHAFGEWRTASEVGVIELGPVRMAVIPGLLAPALGFEVRKMLDAPYRWLLCLSNDDLGFIEAPGTANPEPTHVPSAQHPPSPTLTDSQAGTVILDEVANLVLQMRREQV